LGTDVLGINILNAIDALSSPNKLVRAELMKALGNAIEDYYYPLLPVSITGHVIDYPGSSAPTGYLKCDGSSVSRTTYATLFSVIGTTFGSGDGSTTFNLPNLTVPLSRLSHVRVEKNAAQTVANTAEKLIYGSTIYDVYSEWDSTNNRFVASQDGYYMFTSMVQSQNYSETTGDYMHMEIYINGTKAVRMNKHAVQYGGTRYWAFIGATPLFMNKDDYAENWWFGTGLGAMNISATGEHNYFTIDQQVSADPNLTRIIKT
jgi:microcystin-dependent protein